MISAEPDRGEVIVYREGRGRARIEVRLAGETVWLSLSQMAQLFGRDKSVISRHLKAVFDSGELRRSATVPESATVQREGKREVMRQVEYYSLDAILSRSSPGRSVVRCMPHFTHVHRRRGQQVGEAPP